MLLDCWRRGQADTFVSSCDPLAYHKVADRLLKCCDPLAYHKVADRLLKCCVVAAGTACGRVG